MTITFIGLRTVFVCFNYVALLDVALEVETVKWGLLIMATMLFADWKLREHE
jgi:ribose/xylose/arabinose/galactoside ABC-type transport system permease subunit